MVFGKKNLFHTLRLGPLSKETTNFFNKSWVIGGTMIVEEYLVRKVWRGEDPTPRVCEAQQAFVIGTADGTATDGAAVVLPAFLMQM